MRKTLKISLQSTEIFFWDATAEQLYKVYGEEDWAGLYWGGGSMSVPSGIPVCGWEGELCSAAPSNILLPLVTGKRT